MYTEIPLQERKFRCGSLQIFTSMLWVVTAWLRPRGFQFVLEIYTVRVSSREAAADLTQEFASMIVCATAGIFAATPTAVCPFLAA